MEYAARQHSNRTVVSIFGSCRQDSLYERFAVTRIREELTYCHYIEETIQAIKYCKNSDIETELKHGAFRVDLLGKKRPHRKALARDIKRTEVFVVEVASLLEYTDGRHYFHHEAYDSRKLDPYELAHSTTATDVRVTKCTSEETSKKLDKLFELIPKEKTVLVTHISTKPNTDRWNLNEEVRKYAFANDIEYFNPSDILEIWPLESICEIEPVISHFTPMGHEIIGDRLSQHIFKVKSGKSNYVVHKYDSTSNIGFGDFVFGSIFLKQLASKREMPIVFDLSEHPLGEILDIEILVDRRTEVTSLYHEDSLNKFVGAGTYISNRRPKFVSAGDRDFIIRNLLTVSKKMPPETIKSYSCNDMRKKHSAVFHIRFGDQVAFRDSVSEQKTQVVFENTLRRIKKINEYFKNFQEYIILSDSQNFREYAAACGLNTSLEKVQHFNSQIDRLDDSAISMLREYLLLVGAENVIQFSVYSWGSGFSESASLIGGGKLSRFQIESIS